MSVPIRKKAIELIKQFEGFRSDAYLCPAGYLTIGYGHRLSEEEKGITHISEEMATAMLIKDISKVEDCIFKNLKGIALRDTEYDALISFIFNIGCGNFKSSTMLELIKLGEWQNAADEFLRWNHSKGKVLEGLTKRRKAERELFLCGHVV